MRKVTLHYNAIPDREIDLIKEDDKYYHTSTARYPKSAWSIRDKIPMKNCRIRKEHKNIIAKYGCSGASDVDCGGCAYYRGKAQ